jgi:hypothetical protein
VVAVALVVMVELVREQEVRQGCLPLCAGALELVLEAVQLAVLYWRRVKRKMVTVRSGCGVAILVAT